MTLFRRFFSPLLLFISLGFITSSSAEEHRIVVEGSTATIDGIHLA